MTLTFIMYADALNGKINNATSLTDHERDPLSYRGYATLYREMESCRGRERQVGFRHGFHLDLFVGPISTALVYFGSYSRPRVIIVSYMSVISGRAALRERRSRLNPIFGISASSTGSVKNFSIGVNAGESLSE